jgi:uncharacterized membrane protein YkvA (DUF1232 family)
MVWDRVIQAVVALLVSYVVLLIGLAVYARRHPDVISLADAVRLGPDVLRLARRLVVDRTVPGRSRILLVGLVLYLLAPIDVVPDFLPVIGYADDVVVIAIVLRSVVRRAGAGPLTHHWPGSEGGLRMVCALAGLDSNGEERGKDGRGTGNRNTA